MRHALILLCLVASSAFAGRSKLVEMKSVPKSIKSISDSLPKEKKDQNRRAALSLALDDMLRQQPEVADAALYDQLAGALFNDVLDRMAEPGDAFTTEFGPEKFQPRADLFFREAVKVRPYRITQAFHRKYTKKMQGKNIDRAYKNQPLTLDFAAAKDDDEFLQWTETKGWGVIVHVAHVSPGDGIARIGCTFISPGSKELPGGRFERPSWVAFYKQPKPGVGSFQLLAIEPVTSIDWREQPINIIPPKAETKAEANELAKKLALQVWMEQVRALPARAKLEGQEAAIFDVELDGNDKIGSDQLAWLEPYRDSDSAQVRAAATLKAVSLGGTWSADSVFIISRGNKSAAVREKLEALLKKAPAGWTAPPLPAGMRDEVALAAAAQAAAAKADAGTPDGGAKK